jgi:hypothetical protein
MFQPPTDNLYKFMAIVGLVLWVGGSLYPWTKAYEVERELITLEAEVQHAQDKSAQSSPIELEKRTKLLRLLFKATIGYFVVGVLSLFVGGFLMYFGFKLWYIRVQKPLDEKLKNEKA